MRDLIRAELLKLRTTRMFWGNVAAALAFVPVTIALSYSPPARREAPSLPSIAAKGCAT